MPKASLMPRRDLKTLEIHEKLKKSNSICNCIRKKLKPGHYRLHVFSSQVSVEIVTQMQCFSNILGCTSCKEIQVIFKGEPSKGYQNKKVGYYTINGIVNGRDIWKSTKNA